ncbi:MAG TPA: UDP-N-acetylglucosamine 1-carboxyvinyltransferase [Pirellulales bacterium]|jgi:UDP-N-acetylglucosamine 1-carboxyvinyltransferase|nr:UDP-N-acetylglucosamine 1-carboxyvinyltransferase [Pirellulales bacterium]
MEVFRIDGGRPLVGQVAAGGAKNAALPIMAAAILARRPVWLEDVPDLIDVRTLALVLSRLGVETSRQLDGRLRLQSVSTRATRADYQLVRRMRASFCVLGPLVARRGRAAVALPGGCDIGDRPVDLHLRGLAALGADVRIEHGYVIAQSRRLVGTKVAMSGPHGPTVTGTANVLCAATLARGRTVMTGAAVEPEIVDLGRFLNVLGARIEGLGTPTLEIEGVEALAGGEYRIIPDRIETATLLLAAAITQGCASVTGVVPEHLAAVLAKLDEAGAELQVERDRITLTCRRRPRPTDMTASPYPGLPTDLQSQWMAWMTLAPGQSAIRDNVFGKRFRHVAELNRLSARIECHGGSATVNGVERLTAAEVSASDLRASAALVLAALAADGQTIVHCIHHLDRGYQRLDDKLAQLGAAIERTCEKPSYRRKTPLATLSRVR